MDYKLIGFITGVLIFLIVYIFFVYKLKKSRKIKKYLEFDKILKNSKESDLIRITFINSFDDKKEAHTVYLVSYDSINGILQYTEGRFGISKQLNIKDYNVLSNVLEIVNFSKEIENYKNTEVKQNVKKEKVENTTIGNLDEII